MKNIFRFLMAVAVLLTASCAKEDISSSIGGGEVEMTFTVDLPELGTRAYADGAKATTLRYYVYDGDNYLSGISSESLPEKKVTLTNGKAVVTLPLLKGMTYNIIFWADNGSDIYSIDPATKVLTVDYTGVMSNDDSRDAFYKYLTNVDPTDATKIKEQAKVTLTRPFGQLNAATSDFEAVKNNGVTLTTSTLKAIKANNTLDLTTGLASNQVNITFAEAAIPTETLKAGYKYLSMNYLLPGTVDAEYTFKGERSDNSVVEFTGTTYTNVPVKANFRTNILGALLTAPTNFTVEIEAGFNQPDEFAPRFDPANRTVTIGSAEEFLGLTALSNDWAAKFSNGLGTEYSNYAAVNGGKGADYYYKWDWTIKLDSDIDLKDVTLDAPIYVADWKLFDGQGHTIKNVNIVTANNILTEAGLFIGGKNCGFKNIVLDNVNVTGSLVGNSTAAILAADCNSAEGATGITIKNSSVWGGKYTGGVVGYGYTHTTDCVLENCVIKGGYKLGGVIGYICSSGTAKAVDNHTLTNCTVAGTDGQYAGGKSEYVMGRVVGNFNTDGSCQNNKISNMTTVATENIGQIEAGKNVTVDNNKITPLFDPANRTVTIGSAEEFLGLTALSNDWAAKFSNGQGTAYSNYAAVNGGKGADYYYKWDWTVKLDADIDLKDVTLDAPIYVADWKLFDGQGHTIKNVNVVTASNTENSAGLFIGGKNCGFKNIVLDNIKVTGSLVGNSTAAILAADCNSTEGATGITIKNSSVWGGKYTGGVVGYGYTHTTDCVLENCVIKGGYKLGGVIGYICSSGTAKAVDNHTLTNCTVAGTDGQYAGGKSEYVMGRVVGNFNTDGSCQNNTISNMTTVATENIGQIEAGKTVQQ